MPDPGFTQPPDNEVTEMDIACLVVGYLRQFGCHSAINEFSSKHPNLKALLETVKYPGNLPGTVAGRDLATFLRGSAPKSNLVVGQALIKINEALSTINMELGFPNSEKRTSDVEKNCRKRPQAAIIQNMVGPVTATELIGEDGEPLITHLSQDAVVSEVIEDAQKNDETTSAVPHTPRKKATPKKKTPASEIRLASPDILPIAELLAENINKNLGSEPNMTEHFSNENHVEEVLGEVDWDNVFSAILPGSAKKAKTDQSLDESTLALLNSPQHDFSNSSNQAYFNNDHVLQTPPCVQSPGGTSIFDPLPVPHPTKVSSVSSASKPFVVPNLATAHIIRPTPTSVTVSLANLIQGQQQAAALAAIARSQAQPRLVQMAHTSAATTSATAALHMLSRTGTAAAALSNQQQQISLQQTRQTLALNQNLVTTHRAVQLAFGSSAAAHNPQMQFIQPNQQSSLFAPQLRLATGAAAMPQASLLQRQPQLSIVQQQQILALQQKNALINFANRNL